MKVLYITLDRSLGDPHPDVAVHTKARETYMASFFDRYDILILTPKHPELVEVFRLKKMTIRASCSQSFAHMVGDGVRIGQEIFRTSPFDLVTTQDPLLTGLTGYLLKKRLAVPLHMQIHGDYLDHPGWLRESSLNPWYNRLGKAVLKKADAVTTVHEDIAQKIRSKLKTASMSVSSLSHGLGINTAHFFKRVDPHHLYPWKNTDAHPVVFFAGRMTSQKNLIELVRAVPLVLKNFPKTLFVLAGTGDLKQRLQYLARKLDVDHQIIFPGKIPEADMPTAYQSADIFVLPSLYEGHARALMEAGVCGLPVVTTPVSGARDIVIDRRNGRIASTPAAKDLADAMLEVIENLSDYQDRARTMVSSHAEQYDYLKQIAQLAKLIKNTQSCYVPKQYAATAIP